MQDQYQTNARLTLADEYIRFTNKNVFLTGKAGTGKTTFLKNIRLKSPKRIVVVAPTGVAAINAGGVTIHSFFQLSFGPNVPNTEANALSRRFTKDKIKAIKAIDLLVIDEISMVRADMLDAIDEVLRRYRNRNRPFGGVQLLMIGDLHQLSPVIKDDEWLMLKPYYNSVFFFESKALADSEFITIELDHIFRQQDETFINLLNKIRNKDFDRESIKVLNERYFPDFEPAKGVDYITLCTHNYAANNINQAKLKSLKGQLFTFNADVDGDFPEHMYPNEKSLELKVGAQVMFVKNDLNKDKKYYNGKIGEITGIAGGSVSVRCQGNFEDIVVGKVTWENIKYSLGEDKMMNEEIIGTFNQYPIKTAWAITIHKSQGLTFERAIIDASASFAHGQVYVALSRCKTLEGLVLSSPISLESIKSDKTISSFDDTASQQDLSADALKKAKRQSQAEWITELFDFRSIKYQMANFYKAVEPNQKLLKGNILQEISILTSIFNQDIGQIVEKFNLQLVQILQADDVPEENLALQERIKKGSLYLQEKLENLIYKPLIAFDIECDNKEVYNQVKNASEQAQRTIFEKSNLLKVCQSGFDSTKYLQTKANIAIDFEMEAQRKPKTTTKAGSSNSQNELYYRIKNWRDETAEIKDVEKYMVLAQKTIENLVTDLPGNKAALAKVSGLGKVKVAQYGDEILEIIKEYCEENGIAVNTKGKEKVEKAPKPEKTETHQISYDLFKAGKSINEIAEIRNFAMGTIEGHLARYLTTGEIQINELMDMKKVHKINDFMTENPTLFGKELKEALGDDYGYGEIRLVNIWKELNQG